MRKTIRVFTFLVTVIALVSSAIAQQDLLIPASKQIKNPVLSAQRAVGVENRQPGRMDPVLPALYGQNGPWVEPRRENSTLDLEMVVWVDAAWTGQASVDAFNPALEWGTDAFGTIQGGIDGAAPGGTVNVRPGAYAETAPGRFLYNATGPYQFGLFIEDAKDGLTIQGVTSALVATPITSYSGILASASLFATNSFGYSGMFVEADDVTISGLELYQITNHNKSIEVIGDGFTFKWSKITDGNSLYFNDWRFNVGGPSSWIQSYHIEGNLFTQGTSIDLASGAGYTGLVSSRQIINNDFVMDWADDYWPAISFNGSGTGIPWFVYSVGAAVITGNSFSDAEQLYIRHRGDFSNLADFDWDSYWNDNTFDKKVMFGTNPPTAQGSYSYGGTVTYPPYFSYNFENCKEIGASIQREIDWAASGDVVLCGEGTYYEHDITVDKSLTLQGDVGDAQPGPGVNAPVVDGENLYSDGFLLADGVSNVTIQGFEIRNYAFTGAWPPPEGECPECGVGNAIQAWVASTSNVTIADNYMHNLSWDAVLVGNDGAIGEHTYWTIARNVVKDYGPIAFYNEGYGLELTNASHAVIEDNDIDAGTGFPAIGILVTMRMPAGQDILIQRNKVRGGFDNGGIYVAAFGYESANNTLDGVVLQNNDVNITGPNSRAVRIVSAYTGTVTNVTVFDNSLVKPGGLGLNNTGSPLVNASGNWWGSNSETAVLAAVSAGSVDYSPWLDSGTDTSPALGFQGDFHVLNISAASPITGALNHIMEALDMTTGSTINLSAGTYGGFAASAFSNLNIIGVSGSTFISPSSLVATGVGHKYTPSMLAAIFINNSTNVTLQNLTIEDGTGLTPGAGGADAIVFWNASSGSMTNCSVHGTYTISGVQSGQGIAVDASAPASSSLTLNNCTIDGFQKNGVDVVNGNTALSGGGNITFNMNGGAITGAGATGVIAQNGLLLWSRAGGTVGGTIDGVVISDFEYTGVDDASSILLYNANGPTTVQNCKLMAELPAVDYVSGHTWNSNCYSDYSTNPGYPGTYEIEDNEVGAPLFNVDNNPNPNGCSDVDLILSDALIGCGTGCNTTLLYLTLGVSGLPNLEVIVDLPAGFSAQLPLAGGVVTPGSNSDPNLIQAYALPINSGTQVQVDMGFQASGSSGDNTKYIACIPVINNSATSGPYSFIGSGSMWLGIDNVLHVDELMLGSIDIEVDCTVPVITNFVNNVTCAFGEATQLVDAFSATLTDADADLETAWVTFTPSNGSYTVFGPTQTSGYAPTFPPVGDAAAFYANLAPGCNTLTLHLLDTECNETAVVLNNVGRDNTAPVPTVAYTQSACYNNLSGDPQYGATKLVSDLEVSLGAAGACEAATFDLSLTILTETVNAYTDVVSISGYPSAGEATTLWNAIVTAVGANYSGSVTVNWTATDCAGNSANGSFNIPCVDFVIPPNAVSTFDARPADAGVWLDWAWTPDVDDAVEMRIYRSPHTPNGSFPVGYPGYNPQLLNTYDVTTGAFSGWTLVATQLIANGQFTSQAYTGSNNRTGDAVLHHGTFWLDAENGWINGDAYPDELPGPLPNVTGPDALSWRDIYRYVTFVKDAAGNWSTGYTPVKGTNVDHATNYWLGDFSPADAGGFNNSRGRVDSDDLSLLSAVYFGTGTYQNIGPVVSPVENGGVGKSTPDFGTSTTVNFFDLAPFSFNYGAVGRYGNALEFVIDPDPSVYKPVSRLDATPVVTLDVAGEPTYDAGSEFSVVVSLRGNDAGVVKAVEAMLNFDDSQLEVASMSIGSAASSEGTMFAKVSSTTETGQIGLVAAACGGYSTLDDNATLGTVTFRVKAELRATCELELTSIQLLDNTGEIIDVEGDVYSLFSTPMVPDNYALYQNYPNPFNPTTNISFDLKEAGHVKIMVFNTLGQLVALAADHSLDAGRHTVSFDAGTLASGVYIYTINVNGFSDLKKMVLIK